MPLSVVEAVDLLEHRLSGKRRQGAKRLRALADPSTAPAIREALALEVQDPRTWETQYQMVMALAMTGNQSDVPVLRDLAVQPREATMVNVAIGDALVRLGQATEQDHRPVLWCLQSPVELLADGALRAVAMVPVRLSALAVEAILDWLDPQPPMSGYPFWPCVAAVDWSEERVEAFLQGCASGPPSRRSQGCCGVLGRSPLHGESAVAQ